MVIIYAARDYRLAALLLVLVMPEKLIGKDLVSLGQVLG